MLLTFIKLPYVIKIFVLSVFEWPLNTGFAVHLSTILITVKKTCVWCVKRNVSQIRSFCTRKLMFDKKTLIIIIFGAMYFNVYLPKFRKIKYFEIHFKSVCLQIYEI